MHPDEYQRLTARTAPKDCMAERLKNYTLGLVGETGELVDLIKKILYHDHPADKNRLREEAGDVLWYLTGILRDFGLSLDDTMISNIEKLKRRYPDGFDAERSRARADTTADVPDDGW